MITKAPILGLDLDGVSGDYIQWWRDIVSEHLNVPAEQFTSTPTTWGLKEWKLPDGIWEQLAAKRANSYNQQNPIPGVAYATQMLRQSGWRIRVITKRAAAESGMPGSNPTRVVTDTTEWITETGIVWDDLCFVDDKRGVHADLYVDDCPDIIYELRREGHKVVVFDQPYNRWVPPPRLMGWQNVDIVRRLRNILNKE